MLKVCILAFGFGPAEIAILGLILLLLFGNRLPGLMRSLGRSVIEFKKGVNEGGDEDDSSDP